MRWVSQQESVVKAPGWSPIWWDREEAMRQRLLAEAETRYPEREPWTALIELTTAAGKILHGKAATAASRMGARPRLLSTSQPASPHRLYTSWRWRG